MGAALTAPVRKACPGCESAMQIFRARGVEVDRCPFCGGLWLDGGELEQVLGHALVYQPQDGITRRRCPGCVVTLAPVEVNGQKVERCGLCHSVYLDPEELSALAGGEVPVRPADEDQAAGALVAQAAFGAREPITFRCAGCGQEVDLDNGFATGSGMACAHCVGMLEQTPSTVSPWSTSASVRGLQQDAGVGGIDLGNLIGFALRLFR